MAINWKKVGLTVLGVAVATAAMIFVANQRSASRTNRNEDEPEIDHDKLRYGEMGYNALSEAIDRENRERIKRGLSWDAPMHIDKPDYSTLTPSMMSVDDYDMYDSNGERIH